jgi:hypothetical protein
MIMAKTSGLGATINVDTSGGTPTNISNDITNFQFATPRAVQDITGVDKSAMERLLLLADYSVTFNGVFNPALSHTVFNDVASDDTLRTTKIQPIAGSTPYLSTECLYTDYPITRADGGELTFAVPGVLADGTVPAWTNS